MVSRSQVTDIVLNTLAAEFSAPVGYFTDGGDHIVELQPDRFDDPYHRRNKPISPAIKMATTGNGVVIGATGELISDLRLVLPQGSYEGLFTASGFRAVSGFLKEREVSVWGPLTAFTTSTERLEERMVPDGYRIGIESGEFADTLDKSVWPNTSSQVFAPRRVPALAIASHQNSVVGAATLVEDSPFLWQIGIDVSPDHQGRGIGTALTDRVARMAFEKGVAVFYTVGPTAIPSMRNALASGFVPTRVEMLPI